MKGVQTESIINKIIKQITNECITRGENVSETLVAFVLSINKLVDHDSPTLCTMKMQVYFELNYMKKDDFIEEHNQIMDKRLEPVLKDATEMHAYSKEQMEENYRKIIASIVLRSGLGTPANVEVVRETTAALQSVFPQTELADFRNYSLPQRRSKLLEFSAIVTGIRLFNKDCLKGGTGIEDIPHLLQEGIPITNNELNVKRKEVKKTASAYTKLFYKLHGLGELAGSDQSEFKIRKDAIHLIKLIVINCHQYEYFLNILEMELNNMSNDVEVLFNSFSELLQYLHKLIDNRQAVPSVDVFPNFVKLSKLWTGFQNEMIYLTLITNILAYMPNFYFIQTHAEWLEQRWPELSHILNDATEEEVKVEGKNRDEKLREKQPEQLTESDLLGYKCLNSKQLEVYRKRSDFRIEFAGFCTWSLIHYEGLLVPRNNEEESGVMILSPDNRLYAFSSFQAAKEFVFNAEKYLQTIPIIVRSIPELIPFLNLNYLFSKGICSTNMNGLVNKVVPRIDAGVQTLVHPVDSYIDPNYDWNEWEMRRKALKLASLRKKVTHSVQTILSNWKRDNSSQVYLPKDSWTMTRKDSYTQVSKPSTFIHGLRGSSNLCEMQETGRLLYNETRAFKVDLTIPIE